MYRSLSYPHQKSFLPNIRNSSQGKAKGSNIYQASTLCLILCRYFICTMSLDLEHLQRTPEVGIIIPALQKRKQRLNEVMCVALVWDSKQLLLQVSLWIILTCLILLKIPQTSPTLIMKKDFYQTTR